jgi:catechol 2,3-dioxygenase-like lactoylglutathione lyase family enzyme
MRIRFTSIFVDDQEGALRFYTDVLGFEKRADIPFGEGVRWLTVVSPQDPDGPELVLEPASHPAVGPFKAALLADGIPFTAFAVDDLVAEVDRLKGLGVRFTQDPLDLGPVTTAVLADGYGNLLQLAQAKAMPGAAEA